ncbi:TonB-dependent receptor domain-containing protein [Chryseobacterium sp. TY4]
MSHTIIKAFPKISLGLFCSIASLNFLHAQQNDSLQIQNIEVVKLTKFTSKNHQNSKQIKVSSNQLLDHDAGNFLKTLPEFSGVKKAGNFGTDPVLRGFKYEQLNIVTDGSIYAINACPSRMDPSISQINMNTVKEANIYKGPYQFRFGPAVGGTINFVSEKPKFNDSLKFRNRFSSSYDSNGSIFKNEWLSQLTSKKFNLDIFASYNDGDRYKDGNGDEVRAAFKRYSVGTKAQYQWNENNVSSLNVTTNQGRNVEFAALKMDLIYDKTWMAQLQHKTNFRNSVLKEISYAAYLTNVDHSMGSPNRNMVSNVSSKTYGGRIESFWKKSTWQLFSGLDVKHEEAKSLSMTSKKPMMPRDGSSWQDSHINQLGWFNEFTKSFGNSKLTASYRMDYNTANAEDLSKLFERLYGKADSEQINHSFSLGFQKQLASHSDFAIWVGRGQRSGSLTERFINRFAVGNDSYEVVGNPHIKPETNNQADIIYTFHTDNFHFQADVFYALMQNYIGGVLRSDLITGSMQNPTVRQIQNIKKAMKTGFESRAHWQFLPNYKTDLAVAYTYAEDLEKKTPLAEIAPINVKWNLEAQYSKLILGLNYRFSGKQNRINPEFGELKTKDFSVFDVYSNFKLNSNIQFQFEVSNLFNRAYAEHLSRTLSDNTQQRILERGRSFNLGVFLNF